MEREDGVAFLTDPALSERHGMLVAFSERTGGVSEPPFDSLDLAGHVGDDPARVDENRRLMLRALGLGGSAARLTCAEQVHGDRIAEVGEDEAGAGSSVLPGARPPVSGVDALLTAVPDTPLALFFADCVPVVLVALAPVRSIAVVHAGWRGAAAGLPGLAATALAERAGCATEDLVAYVGPHIGPCCYEVGADVAARFTHVSQSVHQSDTIAAASLRLNLGEVVAATLADAGVPLNAQAHSGVCTAENTARFYSYRASNGLTGRHAAIGVVLGAG